MNEEPTRKQLDAEIDEFLKTRRDSRRGGWAATEPGDLKQLNDIIEKLVRLKAEADADGDLTIEWQLVDRQRYERMRYRPVPYQQGFKNKEEDPNLEAFAAHYARVTYNLGIAMAAFQQADGWRKGEEYKFAAKDESK